MKIAYVVHDYHRFGGHSRYVAELASRFATGHEVHVFANRFEDDGATSIRFHSVPAWRANALTTVLTFAVPATLQIDRGFDIVHCQGFCGFRGNVFTSHMCNRAWYLALERWEGGATWRESIFSGVASALEYTLYRFVRHGAVIAVSELVARDIVRFYRCRMPVHIIHHGVDLHLFSPHTRKCWRTEVRRGLGLPEGETVFAYVGNLRKGAQKCIEALAQLDQGRLLFVSGTPCGPYRRLAEEAGLGARALFLDSTREVERIYAAADALLLPTPYDPFAMVVSEAMACGLPVIVSREAGAAELIQHGVNGLLLDDLTNVESLARHMESLRRDQCWATELGAAARRSVEPMSWDTVAERTMRVYERLLQKAT